MISPTSIIVTENNKCVANGFLYKFIHQTINDCKVAELLIEVLKFQLCEFTPKAAIVLRNTKKGRLTLIFQLSVSSSFKT